MTFSDFDITVPNGRLSGQIVTTCPRCSQDRKKKSTKCLSVNLDEGVWNCHHCNWKGSLQKKQYALPTWENKTELPERIVEWFLKRNISQDTLLQMKISHSVQFMPQVGEERSCMCFNYFREGKLINVKYRDHQKNFRLHKDAELILYNLDGITGQKEIYITEGECDALVMVQAGMTSTCSVPNGANTKTNNLEYLDNCWQAFESAEQIYILTDSDAPGNQLADELGRRLGVERCYRVTFGDYKDVNDALNAGLKISSEWIKSIAKPFPIVGVSSAGDFWDDLINIRKHGFPKGWKPRAPFGNQVTIHPGYTSIITGIPGHGKSEHLDQVLLELNIDYDLRGAYFSPENRPTSIHLIKLVEKTLGKNFWESNLQDINSVQDWTASHYYWIYPEDGFDLTNVLGHVRKAVLRHGINWYVLDPWNKLDHQYTGSETAYISRCLDEIDTFNKRNNVHGFIVAHPTKMTKDENDKYNVPNLYSISGSAHFFNKTDLGWTVYKKEHGVTDVHVQKVKFKYWGEIGLVNYLWDHRTGRYYTSNPDYTNWLQKPAESKLIDFTQPNENENGDEIPF